METAEIIYMITVGILLIISMIRNFICDRLIKLYKQKFDELNRGNDGLIDFCLVELIRIHVEKENYEMAKKCNDNLIELRANKTSK